MAVPISNVVRRIVFAPSGTGPYAFTFEILAATDIEVYKGDTLLTLTTDYTVTINPNGTGSVTLVATAGTDNITIVGARTIQRTTDFVTGGDLFANSLNEELDSLTIFTQQNAEAGDRAIRAPVTDPTTIDMTLPVKADRAGKYLSFNASTGDPEVVNTVVDVTAVANNATNINLVAGQISPSNNISTVAGVAANITTVAGIAANVTTVAGVSGNVTTVAGISADVTTVAADGTDIGLVAAVSSDVAALGPIAADITAVAGVNTADLAAVAAIDTDVGTVAGIAANVTTVAGIAANVTSVAGNASNINQVASDTVAINAASANATAAANSATAAASSATSAANSAAAANAVSLGNEPVAPSIRPSLSLDFANTKALDPRITFTRTTTAAYYDGKTVAKAEENLLTYSQEFNDGVWSNAVAGLGTAPVVTANYTTAPDGTNTADRLEVSLGGGISSNDRSWKRQLISSLPTGLPYTYSIYIKSNSGTVNVYMNLVAAGLTSASYIKTITNQWQRFDVSGTLSSAAEVTIGLIGGQSPACSDSADLSIWGAQLEQRSSVSAYTATTTQAITNYIPVLQTAASGTARFDHDPVTGESKGLLIEESRTNLLTYSDDFSNAAWSKTNSTVTSNTVVAPDGTLTGDKVYEDTTSTNVHLVSGNISVTSGTTYTVSAFMKKAERGFALIALITGFPTTSIQVNLTTGAVTTGTGTPLNAFSQDVGNGWFRVGFSLAANSTTTAAASYYISTDGAWANRNYTGDGYSGIYIWGAQLEAGAFRTSYIPTVAATVTRNADAASMTGTNFSSWYRADEGTVYQEASTFNTLNTAFGLSINNGTSNNRIELAFNGSASAGSRGARFTVSSNGATQADIVQGVTPTAGQFYKQIGAYKVNDFALYKDASSIGTDTAGNVPDITSLSMSIGSKIADTYLNGTIKKLAYYPARLTNAELQGLTS